MSLLVWTESPFCSGEMHHCTKWETTCPWNTNIVFQITPYVEHNKLGFILYPDHDLFDSVEEAKAEAQRFNDDCCGD